MILIELTHQVRHVTGPEKSEYIDHLHNFYPGKIYYIDDSPNYDKKIQIDGNHYQYYGSNIGLQHDMNGLNEAMTSLILEDIRTQ